MTAFVNSVFFLKFNLFCAETIYFNNLHNDQTQPDKYRNIVININHQNVHLQVIKLHIIKPLLFTYARVIKINEICGPRISNI